MTQDNHSDETKAKLDQAAGRAADQLFKPPGFWDTGFGVFLIVVGCVLVCAALCWLCLVALGAALGSFWGALAWGFCLFSSTC